MPRELTREQYVEAVAIPRRRFQDLAIDSKGDIHLRMPVSAPCYWFERNELAQDGDRYIMNPNQAVIDLRVDGTTSVLFYLVGSRIDTCTFAFNLTRAQLGNAVAAMRRAKLSRLIPAAASYALEHIPQAQRGILEPELRKLLRPARQGGTRKSGAPRKTAAPVRRS